jgi:hypothetical protein
MDGINILQWTISFTNEVESNGAVPFFSCFGC